MRGEKERWEKSQVEAQRAQADAKKAETDREREFVLRQELQENIANSAHDIKSPTTALGKTHILSLSHLQIQSLTHPSCTLGLAVESLLDTLDNDKPLTVAGRQGVVETLHGMAHTIAALTMIINRSVVCLLPPDCNSASFLLSSYVILPLTTPDTANSLVKSDRVYYINVSFLVSLLTLSTHYFNTPYHICLLFYGTNNVTIYLLVCTVCILLIYIVLFLGCLQVCLG